MKQSNIFCFSFAVLCLACISASSAMLGTVTYEYPAPSRVATLDEVRRAWISTHYDVYNEDVSGEPWAQSVQSWLDHVWDDQPNYYYAVTTQRVSRVTRLNYLPTYQDGIVFDGVWPVYLLTWKWLDRPQLYPNQSIQMPPEWCTVATYLHLLGNYRSGVLDRLRETWSDVSNDDSLWVKYLLEYDYTPGLWSARLLVSNAVTSTKSSFILPMTRLYLRLPYYPAWWAANGSYFWVDYDEALMLRGPYLGTNAPWSDYDGYVLYSTNHVRITQKYRWISTPEDEDD